MPVRTNNESKLAAFNLIELLVVIAIIGILASLLLPGLAAAKQRAYVIQCKSNEKQLALAWTLYSGDHNDFLVPNGYQTAPSNSVKLWVLGSTHAVEGSFLDPFTNTDYLIKSDYAAFADYIKVADIYKCPADHSVFNGQPKVRSYSLNSYMNWTVPAGNYDTPQFLNMKKGADVARAGASAMLLFLDVAPNFICHAGFVIRIQSSAATTPTYYHYPSVEHAGKGVVSFADGHVETHGWSDPYLIKGHSMTFGDLGHFSGPPKYTDDLTWLEQHASIASQ